MKTFRERIAFFILCFLLTHTNSSPVIILIHGSFAMNAEWCAPGGDFFEEIEKYAHTTNERVVPFMWSGKLGVKAKVKAAHALAKLLLSYSSTEKIVLIGHSHGGNVISLASQFIFHAKNEKRDSSLEQLVAKLEEEDYEEKKEPTKREMPYFIATEVSLLIEDLKKECMAQQATFKSFFPLLNIPKPYLIDAAYYLATPIHIKKYAPNMTVINTLFNLYSRGDYIQKVGGLYSRKFPALSRVTNLRVFFGENSPKKYYNPGHSQLHEPIIGRWLLSIPSTLKDFDPTQDGRLFFKLSSPPTYLISPLKKPHHLPQAAVETLPTHQDQQGKQPIQPAVKDA